MLIPLDRSVASVGGNVKISVEGQVVEGKVQASLPLPESHAPLRELATAFTAAWVVIPNDKGQLETGTAPPRARRSRPRPSRTFRPGHCSSPGKGRPPGEPRSGDPERICDDDPVRVLGQPGPERVQVSGLFRPTDALIVSSSVPLVAGTLIRFNGNSGANPAVEATNPDPAEAGELAGITPPRAGSRSPSGTTAKSRIPSSTPAPIGRRPACLDQGSGSSPILTTGRRAGSVDSPYFRDDCQRQDRERTLPARQKPRQGPLAEAGATLRDSCPSARR